MKSQLVNLVLAAGMLAALCLCPAGSSALAQQGTTEPANPGQLENRIEETVTEQQRQPERLNAPT
jgi:hypothetical protein